MGILLFFIVVASIVHVTELYSKLVGPKTTCWMQTTDLSDTVTLPGTDILDFSKPGVHITSCSPVVYIGFNFYVKRSLDSISLVPHLYFLWRIESVQRKSVVLTTTLCFRNIKQNKNGLLMSHYVLLRQLYEVLQRLIFTLSRKYATNLLFKAVRRSESTGMRRFQFPISFNQFFGAFFFVRELFFRWRLCLWIKRWIK